MRGRFIVVEGIDGAGKTTQIKYLAKALEARGRRVVCTAEPTDFESGKMLRAALSGDQKRTPCELAALFTLDRISHNVTPNTGIKALLEQGVDVICDRYYLSTLAYQGSQIPGSWVADLNLNCPEILHPDLTVFLDLSPEQSLERINRRHSQREIYENLQSLTSIRSRFMDVIDSLKSIDRIVVIDASKSIEDVQRDILKYIDIE